MPSNTASNSSGAAQTDAHQADNPQGNGEPVAKRPKRARYVSRACTQCQSRKVRCDGGTPCSGCVSRGQECGVTRTQPGAPRREQANRSTDFRTSPGRVGSSDQSAALQASRTTAVKSRVSTSELLNRLIGVERQIQAVMTSDTRESLDADECASPAQSAGAITIRPRSPESGLHRRDSDRQTFLGEVSMQALAQVKAQIDDLAAQYSETSPISTDRPFTPKIRDLGGHTPESEGPKRSRSWLRELLLSYDIVPEHLKCKTYLQVFFDEIHVLYPFLHAPSIWQTFDYLWKHSLLVSIDDLEQNRESRESVALVFICLALGRCTTSSRIDDADGAQSAGWSFYNVALDLLRSLLNLASDSAISLSGLQILALMVIYLFRLDASETAERTLAHAISSAHILGLHHKTFYKGMDVFEDEMFTRVWWALYVLDRRLSLESGRPFLIQDDNIETRPPLSLSDDWLAERKSVTTTLSELVVEIEAETSRVRHTMVPYLEAYISQSRIATDVWKAIYTNNERTGSLVHNYLDIALDNWWETLPSDLKYHESVSYEEQFSDVAWWQAKQCLSLHMRYVFLRLLIRRPSMQASSAVAPTHNHVAAEAYCAERAAAIIKIFDRIPKTFPRYVFTFMHSMTSATMILYSIVFRNRVLMSIHGNTLLSAVRSLFTYCQRTWVSGKMIRTVSRLNAIVRGTLRQRDGQGMEEMLTLADRGQAQDQSRGSHDWVLKQHATSALPLQPPIGVTLEANVPTNPVPIGVIPSPVSPDFERATATACQSQDATQPATMALLSRPDSLDSSTLWPSISADDGLMGLPSWATADFDFEQAFSAFGHGRSASYAGAESLIFDGDGA